MFGLGLGSMGRLKGSLTLAGKIKKLFAAAQPGAWYDYSLLTQEYQDSTGTTPVTVVEQPLGLVLDGKTGYARGPELVTNATFTTNMSGWVIGGAITANAVGGEAVCNFVGSILATGNNWVSLPIAVAVGDRYFIEFDATWVSGVNLEVGVGYTVGGTITAASNAGVKTRYSVEVSAVYFSGANGAAAFGSTGVATWKLDNISVKKIAGNHLTQATAGARPVVSARVNWFVSTEDISNAAWTKSSVTTTGVDKIVESASSALHYIRQDVAVVGAVYDIMFEAKMAERTIAWASLDGSSNTKWFDLLNGTTGGTGVGSSYITPLADGWYQCKYTFTRTAGSAPCFIGCSDTTTIGAYLGDITKGIFVRKMSTALTGAAYQQVTNSTTYNTSGFPFYSKFDGIDDSMSSTTGGGATSGFFFCQAVKPLTQNTLRTLWSDTGANTGIKVQLDAANKLSFSAGNGITYTTVVTAATVPLGVTSLVTAWDDGTNFNVQVDSGAVAQIARILPTAGTAATTVGKDNGAATSYFNGNLYPEIIRSGTPLTATESATAQAWCKSKAGL